MIRKNKLWEVSWWGPVPLDENGDNDRDAQPEYTKIFDDKRKALTFGKLQAAKSETDGGICHLSSFTRERCDDGYPGTYREYSDDIEEISADQSNDANFETALKALE